MRSPNYPILSLPDAIDHARMIWDSKKRSVITEDEVAKVFGYKNAVSGPGRRKLSALRQYGLLIKETGGWKISDRAMAILHKPDISPAYKKAISEAIDDVQLFRELIKSQPLASRDVAKSYLLVEKEFTESGADGFLDSYFPTKKLVNNNDGDYNVVKDECDDEAPEDRLPPQDPKTPKVPPVQPGTEQSVFPLDEGQAVLQWPSQLSEASYGDFESWLQLVLRKAKRSISNNPHLREDNNGPQRENIEEGSE